MHDINLAICGHAWHGKSTLLGKTIVELNMVDKKRLEAAQEAAKKGRDPSFVFALLVFRQKDVSAPGTEAARGITVHPSLVRFPFEDKRVLVIDTPGQEKYTNNRFYGMFQADVALLVVDAVDGVMPVTEQVLRVLRGYEIPLAGVAITKMDRVDYSEEAFNDKVEEVKLAMAEHGLSDEGVVFIPTSAYTSGRDLFDTGEGITQYREIKWFKGPTLVDFMKGINLHDHRPSDHLRMAVHSGDVYEQVPGVGKAITSLVESGVLKPNQELHFEPLSAESKEPVTARVRSIELTRGHAATPGVAIEEGHPRMLVGIALANVTVRDSLKELFRNRGVLVGTSEDPPSVANELEAEITVFGEGLEIAAGEQWTMHAHVDKVGADVIAITAKRPLNSNEWTEGEFDSIGPGEWGRVVLKPVRPMAIETADKIPPLSRIVLRREANAVAYGRCTKIIS